MNGEKQYVNLKLGKIYRFAGYYWTICELDKAHNTAVLQSHGVTGGTWPGFKMEKFGNSDYYVNSIDGQDISGYDDKMQSLYDIIKEVEDTSATYGKGLYLISMEKDGFTGWAAPGSGNYWQAMKTAAKKNLDHLGLPTATARGSVMPSAVKMHGMFTQMVVSTAVIRKTTLLLHQHSI